jgi:hypothetical protein
MWTLRTRERGTERVLTGCPVRRAKAHLFPEAMESSTE